MATGGGALAAKGAGAASKLGGVSDDLARLGRLARDGEVAGDVGLAARTVDKILPGMKYQKLGDEVPLGGLTKRIDQSGRVTEVAGHTNPYKRLKQDAWNKITTQPVGKLQKHIDDLSDEITESPIGALVSGKTGTRDLLMDVKRTAEDQGITRVTTPYFTRRDAGNIAKKIVNSHQGFMYSSRNKLDPFVLDDVRRAGNFSR